MSKQQTAKELKFRRHLECNVEQAFRLFDSGIVGHVVRPSKDIEIDLFTPCDPGVGGEGGA